MTLLAWMPGAWKATAWKEGAWEATGAPPQPPTQPPVGSMGGFRAKRTRRNVEEDEAILLALLR